MRVEDEVARMDVARQRRPSEEYLKDRELKDPATRPSSPVRRYTDEERIWVNERYGDEANFLRIFDLSILDEDDREEGLASVRAMMAQPRPDGKVESADGGYATYEQIIASGPVRRYSGRCEKHLSLERQWVIKHFGSFANLLSERGWNIKKKGHRRMAAGLVRGMVRQEQKEIEDERIEQEAQKESLRIMELCKNIKHPRKEKRWQRYDDLEGDVIPVGRRCKSDKLGKVS